MRCTSLILALTLAATTADLLLAAPPAFATPGKKPLAPQGAPRGSGSFAAKPVPQIHSGFNPPAAVRTFKSPMPNVKPAVPVFKPRAKQVPQIPVVKPSVPLVRPQPSLPVIKPTLPAFKPSTPTVTSKPPAGLRKPINDPAGVLKDRRGPIMIPRDIAARPGIGPIQIDPGLDANGNGRVDALESDNLPVVDLARGNDANANPPVAGDGNANGPTAWDWVAIGLSAAAFADTLANGHGGSYVNERVVIDRPVIQTVPSSKSMVFDDDQVVIREQPVMVEEAVVTRVETTPEPAIAAPLPQLRAGAGFELPATGLGQARGRVAVKVGAVILECQVDAWTDAGFKATVAMVTLEAAMQANLIVALADGTVAATIPVELLPAR